MEIELGIEEAYILLNNLQARVEWLKDNPDDFSIDNELGHIANIIIKLRASQTSDKEKHNDN